MKYSILVNGELFETDLKAHSRDSVAFELNGRTFEVSFSESVPLLNRVSENSSKAPQRRPLPQTGNRSSNQVCSPIPGVVLEILVTEGALVQEGSVVARIEAMKMENNIFAHRTGAVTKVFVSLGSEVSDGEPLLEIDSNVQ